ncbi:hypothetical protein [Neptunomonas sp.]|uniref:hypothetical protein n=1 Tax=Neptunomonas sp. TaxID=1971898 RepID=UPI003565F8BE
MTTKEQLVEQHIREYESRSKHIDELIVRANEATKDLGDDHHIKTELNEYLEQKAKMVEDTEKFKRMSLDHWREDSIRSAGPMAIWDVLAQKIEELIERTEKKN